MAGLDAFLQKMNCNTIQRKKKRGVISLYPPQREYKGPPHTRGQHHLPLITPTPSSCHTPSRLKGKHNNTGCSLTSRKDPTTLHNTTSTKKRHFSPPAPTWSHRPHSKGDKDRAHLTLKGHQQLHRTRILTPDLQEEELCQPPTTSCQSRSSSTKAEQHKQPLPPPYTQGHTPGPPALTCHPITNEDTHIFRLILTGKHFTAALILQQETNSGGDEKASYHTLSF